jgi:alpha-glucoside transport system substrate-binding protein
MMPTALQRAWWAAMVELVQDPTKLDGILERMTALAKAGA